MEFSTNLDQPQSRVRQIDSQMAQDRTSALNHSADDGAGDRQALALKFSVLDLAPQIDAQAWCFVNKSYLTVHSVADHLARFQPVGR
jgi:hypothetical protein